MRGEYIASVMALTNEARPPRRPHFPGKSEKAAREGACFTLHKLAANVGLEESLETSRK